MATVGVAAGLGLEDLSFVYFDAHDDLETPSTNTNGYFDAMGMSMLKGESWHNLVATVPGFKPLSLDRLVYCGFRDISDESRQKVKDMKLNVVWGDSTKKVDFSTELGNVLDARALGRTHVHLGLDVLDDTLGDGDKIAKIAVHAIFTSTSSLNETGGLLRSSHDSASVSDIQVWIAFV
ncbi:putative arginase [Aureobasidium pullulans]|uniref:Putative arginase n=1 Tax=Aureobasidium pullulans TaxID=5580 RepID=A0A4S9X950_AURPU|nr:putative arginase [Aureobasidium pullulans]